MSEKCPSCKSTKTQIVFGKNVYGGSKKQHFYKCTNCQIVYLYPKLEKKYEKKFYELKFEEYMDLRSKNEIKWDNPRDHLLSNKHEFKRRSKFLKKEYLNGKNILEIGSSSGFMLKPFKRLNSHLFGVEPSSKFREYTNKIDIKTFKNIDEAIKLKKNSIDLLLHYYVLEHIDNPILFLKKIMKLLKKNGLMIFEVPNINDPLITIFKTKNFDNFYWSVVHHWYFSALTLGNLLKKNNFKFSFYFDQRYDLSNHITWMKDGTPGGSGKYNNIFSKKLITLYKNNLIKSGFCDTLGVIIRK